MIVLFVSQCDKQAIKRTSRVLDSFADRIGDRTWRTIITEEGLQAVKKLLRKTASKNTAIACHVIHGRNTFRLAWVVGRRSSFNHLGIVPVNHTELEIINTQYENSWNYLPLIKAMVALASLFHDIGKCTKAFDKKLRSNSKQSDALRHEFISSLFIAALARSYDYSDEAVLEALMQGLVDYKKVISNFILLASNRTPFQEIPDFLFSVLWLIIGHHRLPTQSDLNIWKNDARFGLASLKTILTQDWGYKNRDPEAISYQILDGIPEKNSLWQKQVSKWGERALSNLSSFQEALDNQCLRPILMHARLSLVFGDHLYSSMKADAQWVTPSKVYANTDSSGKLKQYLDEHLVGVSREALHFAASLPRFEQKMESVFDVQMLKKHAKPGTPFVWQDNSVKKILEWKESFPVLSQAKAIGFFGINMASTGTGKTFANAKIIQALSTDESLRYVLCLGLRTLTLQTGDEYRKRIGLDDSELAVLIGSKAVESLHNYKKEEDIDGQSESAKELIDGFVEYESPVNENALEVLVRDEKAKKLLFSPVLVCTIDYMMLATEGIRGGKWMLPYLRMMSSDLVIDEIDDFTNTDLIAIGRLIHLAGMLGRKVIISSATIPPDMAEGYYRLYDDGFSLFARSRKVLPIVGCGWFDEFKPYVATIQNNSVDESCILFNQAHSKFCMQRVSNLKKQDEQGGERRAYLIPCQSLLDITAYDERKIRYYQLINDHIAQLHQNNHIKDPDTGIKISIGCIRVAHIDSCIELSNHLLQNSSLDEIEYRILAYHSRQVLLLRDVQERHLDQVLKCKDGTRAAALQNQVIRNHIKSCHKKNLVFILVCTPVEEVGRDHDFDWAIVEPSSFRSIIQLAGRVKRHRKGIVELPNVGILQFNLKSLRSSNSELVFFRPGYESTSMRLDTHDVAELVDFRELGKAINSCPRILKSKKLNPEHSLIDLEHAITHSLLNDSGNQGPEAAFGWLNDSVWPYTALPQLLSPFRPNDQPMQLLINVFDGEQAPCFYQNDPCVKVEKNVLKIDRVNIDTRYEKYLWLKRAYEEEIEVIHDFTGLSYKNCSELYGEIQIPLSVGFQYSDQFGMKNQKEVEDWTKH